jgi:predicted DNA-binding protein with PD1-like motif
MRNYTFRLAPGQDLFDKIEEFIREKDVKAGCILCGVGSLTQASLRLADQGTIANYMGHFEIVSLTGTLSVHGSHIHISISDGEGRTIGGHLGPGCTIYTTAEIVIAVLDDVIYKREFAEDSGYEELAVYPKGASRPETSGS